MTAIGVSYLNFSVTNEIILKLHSLLCLKIDTFRRETALQKLKYHALQYSSKSSERAPVYFGAYDIPL